jgi:hypothetical protein
MISARGVEISAVFSCEIDMAGEVLDTGMERWRDM